METPGLSHKFAMKNYLSLLCSTSLFNGLTAEELQTLLSQLGAVVRSYGKGEALVLAGEPSRRVGIALNGELEAYRPGPQGTRIPITHMGPGGLFGDVLAGAGTKSPVNVAAAEDCTVLYLPRERLLGPGDAPPALQWRVLRNLVETISQKYFSLDRRLELLMCRSLRVRISLWLLDEAVRQGSDTFTIPLTRAALAEYLGCDRSALSRELGRMQRDGLVETWHGSFKILDKTGLHGSAQEATL